MMLAKYQKLQLVWVGLGLGYNALSYWQTMVEKPALAPTNPVSGAIFMIICGALVLAGMNGWRRLYKICIPVLTMLLIYSGLLLHVMAYSSNASLPNYASFGSWLSAISINVYGVVMLAVGGWIAWQAET